MEEPDPALVQKQEHVQQMVRILMDSRDEITPKQFKTLLNAADGNIDRLIKRLEAIVKENKPEANGPTENETEGNTFDKVMLICREVRSKVLIR
jgi:hypothetical protein